MVCTLAAIFTVLCHDLIFWQWKKDEIETVKFLCEILKEKDSMFFDYLPYPIYKDIYDFGTTLNDKNIDKDKICEALFKIQLTVQEKINELKLSSHKFPDDLTHYSTLKSISYLVKKEDKNYEKDKLGVKRDEISPVRLRLNNSSYMEDPTEGTVLIEYFQKHSNSKKIKLSNELFQCYLGETDSATNIIYKKPQTYMTSFTKAKDKLPLWLQHGALGLGCCYVFDKSFFDKDDEDDLTIILYRNLDADNYVAPIETPRKQYPVYNIGYINPNSQNSDLQDFVQKVMSQIESIDTAIQKDQQNIQYESVLPLLRNIIDQVRFLFKFDYYKHEEEVRLLKFESTDSKAIKLNTECEIPKLYIELDNGKPLRFKEIILGPKVSTEDEIVPYLTYSDKVDKVKKSNILYR